VTLNIFGRKFSPISLHSIFDFPYWSTECVDLVAPDGLVFFTDGSLCEGRSGAGVFFEILNVRESCALGSHTIRSFNPKYMLFWRVRNIAFRRALSTKQCQ
jgi:hypothetical protein